MNKRPMFDRKKSDEFDPDEGMIEGRGPVLSALTSGQTIDKIFILKGEREGSLTRIMAIAKGKKIVVSEVDRRKLDEMSSTKAHQGVIAQAAAKEYVEVQDIIKKAKENNEAPFIILCDEINDPHNLGAIIRTAYASGAHGVVIPKRRSVGLTASVYKASAGALSSMDIAKVVNLSALIEMLKKEGLWIYGADAAGEKDYYDVDFGGGVALVIGSEGKGISPLVKKNCDMLVKIPMAGDISSLNASVAGGILMYEVFKSRQKKL